ncbi:hypothetical protein C8046_14130 [Serinibacter arcticus]|uniref:DUF4132 domain-containing protein n=1 Tax=Serinibacter arcticus TaxID=1655435 RepID=A0A2U1ZXC5_9MICO|nr:DUF4132 domain-containing protein [Serinibacter arcticus]PWD51614.1 hypothetical protein C8046_14130 [Serinibacter arcticus]
MGFLDRFTGGRTKHLRTCLAWLSTLPGDVLGRAVRHVRTGSDADVLSDVAAAARAGSLQPYAYRRAVAPLIDSDEIDAGGIVRLARLWDAAGVLPTVAPRRSTSTGVPVPEIVARGADLLGDVGQVLRAGGRRAVGLPLLLAALESDGYDRETALAAALTFDLRQSSLSGYQRLPLEGAETLMRDSPAVVVAALGATDPEVRTAALDRLTLAPEAIGTHLERVLELTRDSSRRVRQATLNVLDRLPEDQRRSALERAHAEAPAAIARTLAPRLEQASAGPGAAGDVDVVPPPWEPLPATPVGPDVVEHLERAVARQRSQLAASLQSTPQSTYVKDRLRELERLDRAALDAIAADLGRTGPVDVRHVSGAPIHTLMYAIGSAPGVTLRHVLRLASLGRNVHPFHFATQQHPVDVDLRAAAAATEEALGDRATPPGEHVRVQNGRPTSVADQIRSRVLTTWNPIVIAPEHLWPYFAERLELLEEGLGLRPTAGGRTSSSPSPGPTLDVLEAFPRVPQRFVARLTELALGDGRSHRTQAQDLLSRQGGLAIAVDGLTASAAEIRATAARWLARIVADAAPEQRDAVREDVVETLSAALGTERREVVQAAILGSLRTIGVDISAHLSPAALGAAATAGLKKKAPAGMAWVPLDQLPAARWADGSDVDPAILRWWAVLAVKLKDPTGEGLIPLYVSLLDVPSRQALGSFVLGAWIAHDLTRMTEDDVRAAATAEGPARLAQYQRWAQHGGQHAQRWGTLTLADAESEIAEGLRGTFLGSAIKEKGLLALASGAPGHELTEAITRYAKRHPERRSQIETLVVAASVNDDPAALQAVISVARSFKQRTVRERAGELVEQIAQQRGWSPEELADRTIPTAGFPSAAELAAERDGEGDGGAASSGVATLDYGSRQFTMRIGDDLALALFSGEGKPLKTLPKPGVKDDAELAKAARSAFSSAKKELVQVVDLQSARLQEAMALGRTWDAATWRTAFLEHPVMRHLVSRLVWAVGPVAGDDDADSPAATVLFAPTLDGELLDAEDGEVELPVEGGAGDAGVRIWLTHVSGLEPDVAQHWRERLADYGITPLFDQLDAATPRVEASATEITDRQGWVMTVGALKTRAARHGYRPAAAEDGGWVGSVVKDVGAWQVAVEITGTYPGQEVGESLAITRLVLTRGGRDEALRDVPPVLLAVAYNDYLAIADGGAFDPEWAKRTGF